MLSEDSGCSVKRLLDPGGGWTIEQATAKRDSGDDRRCDRHRLPGPVERPEGAAEGQVDGAHRLHRGLELAGGARRVVQHRELVGRHVRVGIALAGGGDQRLVVQPTGHRRADRDAVAGRPDALAEVREARLVPVLDFKGRKGRKVEGPADAAAPAAQDGGQDR